MSCLNRTRSGNKTESETDYNVPINITTGPVAFEGQDYVSRADFEAGLAKATQEGARQVKSRPYNG